MEIGVLTKALKDEPLAEALAYFADHGVGAIELGCGGFTEDHHLPTDAYLDDDTAQEELLELVKSHDLTISALATHNNPLHPDQDRAETADAELRDAIRLAHQLDVDAITCFSGLPAGGPDDATPNWVTAPWPPEHLEMLEYQWEVTIDFWGEIAAFAEEHEVNIGIEMHPNMIVYEPHGLLRLREATNERIGANFDPSHLVWQGIDVMDAIRLIGEEGAMHHFHAKDTKVYPAVSREKGVLDTTPYTDEFDRSWLFRTIGYGHGEEFWKDVISTLRLVGYEGAISIEHEDALTSEREGLKKAIDLLQRAVFETEPGDVYWA